MTKRILVFGLVSILALSLAVAGSGCARNLAERAIEGAIERAAEAEGEDVDIDFSDGELNIADEEGNQMSFGGSDIPDDWPSDVPINNGINITFTASQTTDGIPGWSVSGTYDGSAKDLYEYYKKELSDWDEVSDSTMDMGDDGKNYSYQASNGEYFVTIFINETPDEVAVVLSATEDTE